MFIQSDIPFGAGDAAALGGIMAFLAAFLMIAIVVGILLYIYTALVWMTIGKKLGYDKSWIAWIPIVNAFLIPILAKKAWPWGFILFVPIVNLVFYIIWTWNIFEQRKYPGWLSLIPLGGIIPLVGWIASIGYLVVLGLVAWKDR